MPTLIGIRQIWTQLLIKLRTGVRPDRGASLVEYALLVALIAVVCVVAIAYFGTETGDTFSRVSSSVGET